MRCVLFIALLCCASSLAAKVDQDTMPFLVMPDGQKVMATHVLKFPLKREASGLAYDSVTNQFITCFDKGIPQIATFRLNDKIEDLRQLEIKGDTVYYDLEGVDVQRSDSLGIRLKLCGERVIRDSLPILTLRCDQDSCWHDSTLILVRPFEPGLNTNWEGIGITGSQYLLAKEREPTLLWEVFITDSSEVLARSGILPNFFGRDPASIDSIFAKYGAYKGASSHRLTAAKRLALSGVCFDGRLGEAFAINRAGRAVLIFSNWDCNIFYSDQARYELVDHPLEWTGTDTGDLLYGLVEGVAIGPVNGVRSMVMITDPGYSNYPKVVVFPWIYTDPSNPNNPEDLNNRQE